MTLPQGKTASLSSAFLEVLELQSRWSKENTADMARRGELIRAVIPALIRSQLPVSISAVFDDPTVEGRDGTGLKTRVPWVRVFSKRLSPSAQQGWYLVYLVAFDGSAVYLSLNQGTTVSRAGSFVTRPKDVLLGRVTWAREVLEPSRDLHAAANTEMRLADPGGLGEGYESGNVLAIRYTSADLDDSALISDLRQALGWLDALYAAEPAPTVTTAKLENSQPSLADVPSFVKWMQTRYGPQMVPSRAAAEAGARAALDDRAGAMSRDEALALGRLLNTGLWGGISYVNRFSPAFQGASINRLVDPIDNFNAWTQRLWRSEEKDALATIQEIWGGSAPFPGAGHSYPSMIMYLRDPDRYFVWINATEEGLEALGGYQAPPGRVSPVDRYLGFCQAMRAFRDRYALEPQELDAILAAASRASRSTAPPLPGPEKEPSQVPGGDPVPPGYPLTAVRDATFLDMDLLQEWTGLLIDSRKRQALLYGPPGTGKTFVATQLALHLTGDAGRVAVVQFHPSFSYEDFVEGLRPALHTDNQSSVRYEIPPGIFRQFCAAAAADPLQRYVLIVDEINRADLGSVLGELMMLLEYRGPQHTLRLPYSRELFHIPENLILLATMNTADRSLALLDFALRRRFHAFEMLPDRLVLERYLDRREATAQQVLGFFDLIQQQVGDSSFAPGHSYWMTDDLSAQGLERIWKYELRPYLKEFWFEQGGRLQALEVQIGQLLTEAT